MNLSRLSSVYVSTSVLLVNSLVVFVVLNLFAALILSLSSLMSGDENPVSEKYREESLQKVYPHLDKAEVGQLLHETWSRWFAFEPFTQFREAEFQGDFVNVDAAGYRHGGYSNPWPPDEGNINIFVFGGSTTFGYGVEDALTIPSQLQKFLVEGLGGRVKVYNFARGFYYSTQERILFQSLLSSGLRPDVAVFIDGLNDFYHYDDMPLFSDRFAEYVSRKAPRKKIYSELPVVRLVGQWSGRNKNDTADKDGGEYDNKELLANVISRYLANKEMTEAVADAYDIRTLFVWQPVPTYKYDTSSHLFLGDGFARHTYSKYGYAEFRKYLDNESAAIPDFLWAADIQEGLEKPLYVDQVHYTGEFSGYIARMIADHMQAELF